MGDKVTTTYPRPRSGETLSGIRIILRQAKRALRLPLQAVHNR